MINPGSYWANKNDGYEVQICAEEDLVTKAPDGANWHPAIPYVRTDEDDGPIYVRTTDDFLAKFVPVVQDEGGA